MDLLDRVLILIDSSIAFDLEFQYGVIACLFLDSFII